jgi:two-component system KDP operon response regulator KdpE
MTLTDELILVVDDEPGIVRALTAALRARAHKVSAVTTGTDALSAVAGRPPDVVILDLALPDLDGEDAKAIHAEQRVATVIMHPGPPDLCLVTEPG